MKARFDVEQPPVKIINDGDKVYIYICLNGKWTERNYDESQEPQKVWECDYREIITSHSKIDIGKVKENPEEYIDWTEQKEKTDAEKIVELQEQNEMLVDCLMEMSEIVYA